MIPPGSPQRPFLDVEDDDARQQRLQHMLENVATRHDTSSFAGLADITSSSSAARPQIHAVSPPTDLINRLEHFMPQLAQANAQLADSLRADPASVDIENLDDEHSQHIEMNLTLGVFDIRSPSSALDLSEPVQGQTSSSSDSSDSSISSDHDSDGNSEEDDSDPDQDAQQQDTDILGSIPAQTQGRPIRPLPKRPKPSIVELTEAKTASDLHAD